MTPESQIQKTYTVPEFAARIRARYPSETYNQMSDEELTMRMIKKHPVYRGHVNLDTLGSATEAEAQVSRAKTQFEQASSAYTSATGRALNPPAGAPTNYFRQLTTAEKEAQKRGEPVIISEAAQEAATGPETATRPRVATQPPVSLEPVIQSHLEQIQRERRQRELRAKVEQARAVRRRAPRGLMLPPGQKNRLSDYQPKFGGGQTYRQVPRIDTSVPNPVDLLTRAVAEPQPTFEQDRANRVATKKEMERLRGRQGVGAYFGGEEYKNFLLQNRTLDNGNMREQFLTLKAKQQIAQHGSILGAIAAEDQETARQARVARMGRGEYLAQLPKSLIGAPISAGGTALKGLAVASRKLVDQVIDTRALDMRDTHVYQLGEMLTKAAKDNPVYKSNPDLEQEFWIGKAPDAVGQSAIFLLGGWVSKSPKLAVAVLGGTLTAGDAYDEVRALGGSDEEAVNAGLIAGAVLGPTELLGYRGMIKALEGAGAVVTLKAAAVRALKEGSKDAMENAAQEAVQEGGQGLITGKHRSASELAEAALLGLVASGPTTAVTSFGASAIESRRAAQPLVDYAKASPLTTAEQKAQLENLTEPTTERVQAILQGESSTVPTVAAKEVKPESRPKEAVSSKVSISPGIQENITETITRPELERAYDEMRAGKSAPPFLQGGRDLLAEEGAISDLRDRRLVRLEAQAKQGSEWAKAELERMAVEEGVTDLTAENVDAGVKTSQPAAAPPPKVTATKPAAPAAPKAQAVQTADEIGRARDYGNNPHPTAQYFNKSPLKPEVLQALPAGSTLYNPVHPTSPELQAGAFKLRAPNGSIWEMDLAYDHAKDSQWKLIGTRMDGFAVRDTGEIVPATEPAVTPPAEVKTQPTATESQLSTVKEVTDEVEVADRGSSEVVKPTSVQAPGQRAVPDKLSVAEIPVSTETKKQATPKADTGLQPEVARSSTSSEEAKHAIPAKLTEWSARLKAIAQAKDLDQLQALSDEMAAHKDDPRVARLRTSIQDKLAKARQPEIPESPKPGNKITSERANLSQAAQKTLNQAETPEGKIVRPSPSHRIGAPKTDASRNSVEQQVRSYGGIKDDASQAYKGELGWLKESGKRGTVNQTGGISVEEMATRLAQDGYGKGVWWEGAANNVDPQAFLQAVMDDTRGQKHYSTERDEIEDDPDVTAWDALTDGETGKELIERVQSGHARAADIVQFVREASAHGLSDNAIDAFVAGLQRTVQEELSTGTQAAEGYSLNEDGTLLDPDGTPLFAREFQLGLPSEGLTQQAAQPKTADQRERLRREQQERDEAASPQLATARRKLEEIRRRGMTVDEYSRQGSMFEAAPSAEEIKLLKDLERKQPPPESGQSSMFARAERESGQGPISVEGNRINLGEKGAEALSRAYRKLDFLTRRQSVGGAVDRKPERLAKTLDELGETELAKAVREAAVESPQEVVLYEGKSELSHELFHVAAGKAGNTLRDRHSDLDSLTDNNTFDKIYRRLTEMGYSARDIPTLVEEAAAHIAEGRYEALGITREEAVEWMFKWFKSFEAKNPHVNPRQFQEMSDEATKARDEVYAQSAASQSLNDEALPGVQAGREGGDRESIAAARDSEYQGEHAPADAEGGAPFHGLNLNGIYPDDVYGPNGLRYYPTGYDALDYEAYSLIQSYRDHPNRPITIYRAVPKDVKGGIRKGDWVTPIRGYAVEHGKDNLGGDYKIQKKTVHARDLFTDGNSWLEWGYDPQPFDIKSERARVARRKAKQQEPELARESDITRGTFDPNDPNILMARSDDPWADLMELSEEFGRLANEPELAPGEQPLSLPKTLEAADLEAGPARGYLPESIVDDGLERAKQVITDKGIDGAMEFVRTGDGIEWASTGYEVSGRLRAEESTLRAEGKTDKADEVRDKRLKFLDDFALGAVERGRSIVGIKAIAEYAPDRMAYMLNKASLKKRKRGISPEEESRITKLGKELGALGDRNKALQKALDAAKGRAQATSQKRSGKPKKSDYQSALDQQAATVLQTLKPKVGKFDFSGLGRPAEKGAVTIGIPALPGDAELIAQYAAAQLSKLNTVSELNQHLVQEFGQEVEPHLSKIRQRAFAIRQEARLAEIESEETEPKRRKTILSEIQKEIGDSLRTIREAQKAQDLAVKAERRAEAKAERTEARLAARRAREQASEEQKQVIKEARRELKRLRQEMKEASQAETKGYRETIKAQKDAARKAELWDTPIRNEALAASERLKDAVDSKDPETMADLVSVAAAKFLPEKEGGAPRTGAVEPARVYRDLKEEFPALVTKKNQAEIYKRGYQRIQDATAAAREAARMRSASAEAKRLWDDLGVDVDAQGVLIQQAEVRRQTDELRGKAVAEFNRINRSPLGKVWMESNALFRALQSSIDAPLGRQGWFLVLTHPVLAAKYAIPATTRGYTAIHQADWTREVENLRHYPDYKLGVDAGLQITETAGASDDPRLQAEEIFSSTIAEKLPHVRLSEQGFVNAMNTLRLSTFSHLAAIGRAEGKTWESDSQFYEQLASFINDVSGRGTMGHKASIISSFLNGFFYSTRLNVSRFQLLNDLFNPIGYIPEKANLLRDTPGFRSYDPTMRRIAAAQVLRMAVALGSIYLLASLLGFRVEFDPEDADAFLLRFRNTRWDVTGGEAGTIRFIYRFLHSIEKKATGQDLQPFEEPDALALKYLRYKLAPIPSGVVDGLTGKDAVGNKANFAKYDNPKQFAQENIIFKRVSPMLVGTFIDTVSMEGWLGVPMALPALTGMNVSSYPDRGLRALKNQTVRDELENLKITSQSLLGQKTKDDEIDKAIESRIMQQVETLDIPTGATDIGKEKIIRERLAQIRLLAKAEAALADPSRYQHYLSQRDASESLSFLTDEEKKTLTEDDLKAYRQSYAENYLKTLQRVAQTDNYQRADDDKKEKILARVGQAAHTLAKVGMVKLKRKGRK